MSEDTSLTDAVKHAAGISLTEAVQSAAGRRAWVVDVALETLEDAARGGRRRHACRRLLAGCAQLAAIAILSVHILLARIDRYRLGSRAAAPRPQKRVALVIGNSAYRYTPRLENPRNDATDIGAALRKLGFQVIEAFDLDKAAFEHGHSRLRRGPAGRRGRRCSSTPGMDCWYRARTISCPSMRS